MLYVIIIIELRKTNKTVHRRTNKMKKTERISEKRVYELAYDMLLMNWGKEYDYLEENPDDEIAKNRVEKLWNELEQLKKRNYGKILITKQVR